MAQTETLWLWRAWSVDRARICDCGVVRAIDAARASGIASMCLGGPWRHDVVEIEVEDLAQRYLQTHDNTINASVRTMGSTDHDGAMICDCSKCRAKFPAREDSRDVATANNARAAGKEMVSTASACCGEPLDPRGVCAGCGERTMKCRDCGLLRCCECVYDPDLEPDAHEGGE